LNASIAKYFSLFVTIGLIVGIDVGDDVGIDVGDDVGIGVGIDVGIDVGEPVTVILLAFVLSTAALELLLLLEHAVINILNSIRTTIILAFIKILLFYFNYQL
jgi:hypothetical protein